MNRLQKITSVILCALICGACAEPKDDSNDLAASLEGEYEIVEITWTGLPIDINEDGNSERNLLKELQGTGNFIHSMIAASVVSDSDKCLNFGIIIPIIRFSDDSCDYIVEYIDVNDLEEWNGSDLCRRKIIPSHWTTDKNEESCLSNLSQGGFTFSFRTSIYDRVAKETRQGRVVCVFKRK